jgi:ATP-dependent helicase/DNAse subunit B
MPHNDDSEFELAAMRRSGRDAARRPQVRGGMDVVGQRNSSPFTRHDGNVHAPDVTRGDGITSPTRLETYARCPSRYFLGSVLRVAEFEEPEEVRALSALDRGSIIHDTLEQFYRETAGRDPGPWSDTDRQRLTAIALEHCGRYEQLGRTGGRALWNIERSRLVAELVDYLDADALRSQQFGTRFLSAEVAFGEGDESWPPVEIPLGSGSVRFRGRIDRVDEGPGGTYWVYDYKTGSAYGLTRLDDDPLDSGKRLQLPVYAEAVRGALGATDVRAGYWMVSDANGFGVKELPAGQETRAALVYSLQHIADGIEGGVFIANPGRGNENCTFCPYTAICPSERSRMYVRKIADPAAAPYAALTGDAE